MAELRRTLDWQPETGRAPLRCSLTQQSAAETALALILFDGAAARGESVAAHIRVRLAPLLGTQPLEHWFGTQPAKIQQHHAVHARCNGDYLMAAVEVSESGHGGIRAASEFAYRHVLQFQKHGGYPHILRMWNYFADINAGDDDAERYRQFCAGRAAALSHVPGEVLPAASAIGTHDREGVLQVYWLASRTPGRALENPRQLSAYRYPRQYGPASPSFSRAMLSTDGTLFISGTASIVGHASRHEGDLEAQLQETLANIDTLIAHAHELDERVPPRLGAHSTVKFYVRHAQHAATVAARLREHYGAELPLIALHGDICRRELLLEIECVHARASHADSAR